MPFKSEAQRRYLYAKHPDVAEKYQAETPPGTKLPERVHWIHRKWHRTSKRGK